jgi:hypothetical protein
MKPGIPEGWPLYVARDDALKPEPRSGGTLLIHVAQFGPKSPDQISD